MRIVTMLLAVAVLSVSMSAATIRVPQDQLTIQAGINAANTNDTVLVGPGLYSESIDFLGKLIVVTSKFGPEFTTIRALSTPVVKFVHSEPLGCELSGIGFRETIGNEHIAIGSGAFPTIKNNIFWKLSAEEVIIKVGGNANILRNLFYENSVGNACIGVQQNHTAWITNNTFDRNSRGFYSLGLAIARNNIITNSQGYGIYGNFPASVGSDYNDVFNNGQNYAGGVLPGENSISEDPLYLDPIIGDYRLSAGSPCIDAGDPDNQYDDPDGTRSDLGAYFARQTAPAAYPLSFGPQSDGVHVHSLNPEFNWVYTDTTATSQAGYEIEIGTDTEWSVAETWQSGQVMLSENHATYTGTPLSWFAVYYLRIRVNNGTVWGEWIDYYFITQFGNVIRVPQDRPTITEAIELSKVGDTVLVSPGTYGEQIVINLKNVNLLSSDGPEVTFLSSTSKVSISNCNNTSIAGFQFLAGGVNATYAGNCTVENCRFIGVPVNGLCLINGDLTSRMRIRRCLITNYNDLAIFLQAPQSEVINCTIVGGHRGLAVYGEYSVIKNNIVMNMSYYGTADINFGTQLDYNDFWSNFSSYIGTSTPGPNDIQANPMFRDAANGDYSLVSSSPCIEKGDPAPEFNDPDGTRNDIGAFPYVPPIAVAGITISGQTDLLHVLDAIPQIAWTIASPESLLQTRFTIAFGTDDDWEFSEMWNPAPFTSGNSFVVYNGSPLIDGQIYWLRLRVGDNIEWSNWYELMFRMNSLPSIPLQHSPATGSIVSSLQPLFVVRNANDSENDSLFYEFQLSSDSSMAASHVFSVPEGLDSLTGATVDVTLTENAKYFWRVRAGDYYEYSAWSPVKSIWVNSANSAPAQFDLTSPTNTYTPPIATRLPLFSWLSSNDIDPLDIVSYSLHLASDSTFNDEYILAGIAGNQVSLPDSLVWGSQYWWKVLAEDQNGGETWSASTFRFRIMKIGDNDANGVINITDIVYIINFLFADGPAPIPPQAGNANCDDRFNITDAVYLINYIFADGPQPCSL